MGGYSPNHIHLPPNGSHHETWSHQEPVPIKQVRTTVRPDGVDEVPPPGTWAIEDLTAVACLPGAAPAAGDGVGTVEEAGALSVERSCKLSSANNGRWVGRWQGMTSLWQIGQIPVPAIACNYHILIPFMPSIASHMPFLALTVRVRGSRGSGRRAKTMASRQFILWIINRSESIVKGNFRSDWIQGNIFNRLESSQVLIKDKFVPHVQGTKE